MPDKAPRGGGVKVRSPSNPKVPIFVSKQHFAHGYYEKWTEADEAALKASRAKKETGKPAAKPAASPKPSIRAPTEPPKTDETPSSG